MTTVEEWRPVVGYEGYYEVSDQGRVRSLDRAIPNPSSPGNAKRLKGRQLAASRATAYPTVVLFRDGRGQTFPVHALVALVFIGPRPPGLHVCHNNGNPFDNRAANLRHDTPSSNELDTVKHGSHFWANKTHCKWGHEFTEANTYRPPNRNQRTCRTCAANRIRKKTA